jgi:RNA polymerase sigma factor (sigma-70 family)
MEMSELPDGALLARYRQSDDQAAFAVLLSRHAGTVYGAALRVTGDPHLAEDVGQQVFVLLAERAATLAPRDCLAGWLYLTAVNIARNARRKLPDLESSQTVSVCEHNPSKAVMQQELSQHLDEALAALPERLREAMILHHCEGKSIQQTADTLACKPEAVRKRLVRARQRLRSRLRRLGVVVGGAAIAPSLFGASVPPTLEQQWLRAIPPAAASTSSSLLLTGVLAMSTGKLTIAAAVIALIVAITIGVLQTRDPALHQATRDQPVTATDTAGSGTSAAATIVAAATSDSTASRVRKAGTDASRDFLQEAEALLALLTEKDVVVPNRQSVIEQFGTLMKEWGAARPNEAVAWAAGLQNNRPFAQQALGEGWAAVDPVAAGDWAVSLDHSSGLSGVARSWGRLDPQAAVEWVEKMAAPTVRHNVSDELAAGWASADPEAAAAWAATLGAGTKNNASRAIAEVWAKHDPRRAAEWATGIREPMLRDNTLSAVASSWAASDPADAALWAQTITPRGLRDKALAAIAHSWGQESPVEAISLLSEIGDASLRQSVFGVLAFVCAEASYREAMPLLSRIERADQRERAAEKVARHYGAEDLVAATKWAIDLDDGLTRDAALKGLIFHWRTKDRAHALELIQAMESPRIRSSGTMLLISDMKGEQRKASVMLVRELYPDDPAPLKGVYRRWAAEDPDALLAFADGLEDKESRSMAYGEWVMAAASKDPQQALQDIAEIEDPEVRRGATEIQFRKNT